MPTTLHHAPDAASCIPQGERDAAPATATAAPTARSGLSAARERQAKELLATRMHADISLADVARACGLSRTHFTVLFRRSTGMPPHQWLLKHKLDQAKLLLKSSSLPIAEVALVCGFADQSHLTRLFSRTVALSPAAWRRALATGQTLQTD